MVENHTTRPDPVQRVSLALTRFSHLSLASPPLALLVGIETVTMGKIDESR